MRRAFATFLAVCAATAAGCGGGDDDRRAGLAWDGAPKVFRAKNLPDDRVVIARVRNTGSTTLHVVAGDLRVRDAEGRALETSAAFTTNYAHGLFGALQQPRRLPAAELIRLGKVAYIPAGASLPFYAAWRLRPGSKGPLRIDYGSGTLTVPGVSDTAAGR